MNTRSKLKSTADIQLMMIPRRGRTVFTNGAFDLIHCGHVEYLEAAASLGDSLIVAINSDRSVRELKGPTRPINSEQARARVVGALQCVDLVLIFGDLRVDSLLRAIKPDVWAKGGDYTLKTLNKSEVAAAKEIGCEIRILPLMPGISTTETINKLKA